MESKYVSLKDDPTQLFGAVAYATAVFVAIVVVFIPIVLPYRLVKWALTGRKPFSDEYNKNTFFGD